MDTVTLTSSNNQLLVSKSIVADSVNVKQLNISDEIYLNSVSYTPVGSILTYAGSTAPTGWLLCDGTEVSKTEYPRLFEVIGNSYGNPVNSNNFILPDIRDRVPVGKSGSNNLGDSSGNSTITLSQSQLPSHTHTGTTVNNGSHSHTGTTDNAGSHTHGITDPGHVHYLQDAYFAENRGLGQNFFGTGSATDSDNSLYFRDTNTGYSTTGISINSEGSHSHTFTTGTAGSHTHTFTTDSTGNGNSIDIRNKFIILNYIIRY
jgi:microcystin-dependent protein